MITKILNKLGLYTEKQVANMLVRGGIAVYEATKEEMITKATRKSFKERLKDLEKQENYQLKQ